MNLFSSLGIDWQTLILQIIAFAILVLVVAKFVVPILLKSVDARQEAVEASLKAAREAELQLSDASERAAEQLREARKEAAEIITSAKEEATAAIEGARDKAKADAERIVKDAHEQIERDIEHARMALRDETVTLVAKATETIARVKIDQKSDSRFIETALKEAV